MRIYRTKLKQSAIVNAGFNVLKGMKILLSIVFENCSAQSDVSHARQGSKLM